MSEPCVTTPNNLQKAPPLCVQSYTSGRSLQPVDLTGGYCWSTYFNVLGVLFLGEVSSVFLPSKKACWTHIFRHLEVGQQYPPVFSTGHAGAAHLPQKRVETHSIHQYKICDWRESFWNTRFAPWTRKAGAGTSSRADKAFALVCSVPQPAYRHGTGNPSFCINLWPI